MGTVSKGVIECMRMPFKKNKDRGRRPGEWGLGRVLGEDAGGGGLARMLGEDAWG